MRVVEPWGHTVEKSRYLIPVEGIAGISVGVTTPVLKEGQF